MGFPFPIPPGYSDLPIWTGNGFQIGYAKLSVLQYTECNTGWNSNLTEFHEVEANQGNHYIDRASRFHASSELKKNIKNRGVLLEIGSSSGYLLKDIKKAFPGIFLIGSDCIHEPLEKIAKSCHDIPLVQFDLNNCPLPDNCTDIIIALNVLEHIQDDISALRQIHRILKPGGIVIIEVPANQDLYDFYDAQLKHFRRYSIEELSNKVKRSGFEIQKATHLGFFLYPAFKSIKLHNKNKKVQSERQVRESVKNFIKIGGPILNTILYSVMRLELLFGDRIEYPKGIRCLITLIKK